MKVSGYSYCLVCCLVIRAGVMNSNTGDNILSMEQGAAYAGSHIQPAYMRAMELGREVNWAPEAATSTRERTRRTRFAGCYTYKGCHMQWKVQGS